MKKILLLVLLIFALKHGSAQQGNIKFDHFTIADGLPERQVQFVAQDSRGYIWAGTQNGLVRYDGYKMKVYRFPHDRKVTQLNSSIRTMVEDNNKTPWFSTVGNGIYKYNAATDDFTRFDYPPSGKYGLYYGYLSQTDYKNNLWGYLAPMNGKLIFFKFDTYTKSYKLFNPDDKKNIPAGINIFNSIGKTVDKHIWLTANSGLYAYDYSTDKLIPYFNTQNLAAGFVYQFPGDEAHIWITMADDHAKSMFIRYFNVSNKTFEDYHPHKSPGLTLSNDSVSQVYEDKKHRLWFASGNGLMLFDKGKKTFTNFLVADTDKSPLKNRLGNIIASKSNMLWITSEKGILSFDPDSHQFIRYTNQPGDPASISSNDIDGNSIMTDNAGLLWLGFGNAGFDKENAIISNFTIFTHDPLNPGSYPGSRMFQIKDSKDGYVIFDCKTGFYKWKPGTNKFTQLYRARDEAYFDSFDFTDKNILYFGSDKGFNIYNINTKSLKTFSKSPADSSSFKDYHLQHIFIDHTGLIWLSTSDDGVSTYDPKTNTFKHYPFINNSGLIKETNGKLDDLSALCTFEDKDNNIWVGTNLGGLNKFDRGTGKFKSFLFEGKWHVWCVSKIFQDREGRMWIGSYLDGLYQFDPKTNHYLRQINESNGLLFNTVSDIQEDKDGYIWVTSDRGLTRLDPKTNGLKLFPSKTILPNVILRNSYHDFLSFGDKFIWGSSNGLILFNPSDLKGNPYPPVINVENITYSNPRATGNAATTQPTLELKKIELPWNQNRVTFNYVALHFVNPPENKYSYYLDGYDKHWINAGNDRSVTYTNLSPGTYTFYVKAANSDGVWSKGNASLVVIISSPWWFTWWAWLLYIILFVAVIYAVIHYRSRKLKYDNRILEEKVELRTHQLNEVNHQLQEQTEEVLSQRDELSKTLENLKSTQAQLIQSEKMASLGELTAGIAHEIQNPLNFVNNFSEVSAELLSEMEEELDKGDIEEAKAISADIKQNLEKINQHGKRADGIVKGMLQHSRASSNTKEPTNINKLADEYLRLAYHGLRAKDKSFNAEMLTNFTADLPMVTIVPQDVGRVLLNLFTNAFYAMQQKQKDSDTAYKPTIELTTSSTKTAVVIHVKDNGTGISDEVKDKIMQPFFTTKPTGEGTGLGLSLSYDIIVKGHGGNINVNTKEGEFTEFTVSLPL